ncbi:MAG: hypothetical protein ABSC19_11245 [Syntrophorhabdales bacterium]|jgi:hypothetical protein
MKRFPVISLLVLLGVSVTLAIPSYSWSHGGWGGGWGAGWFVGGLALGTAIGVSARPYYYYPAPAYAYPAPAYAYPAPVYAYPPPPDYVSRPAPAYAAPAPSSGVSPQRQQNTAGVWVTVPGQEINGLWVPEHKAWVPDD